MLDLYWNPISTPSQKVYFFLEEAGIPFKAHGVNLAKGEQREAAFQRVNPFGQVPAIELDGFVLSESNAVLRYLVEKYKKYDWYPQNLEDRAQVDRMMEFASLHVGRWIGTLMYQRWMAPRFFGKQPDQGAINEALFNLQRHLPKLERHLATGRRFLCGPTPTLADAALLPYAAMHREVQAPLADFPRVVGWIDMMTARPAWRKVMGEVEKLMAGSK